MKGRQNALTAVVSVSLSYPHELNIFGWFTVDNMWLSITMSSCNLPLSSRIYKNGCDWLYHTIVTFSFRWAKRWVFRKSCCACYIAVWYLVPLRVLRNRHAMMQRWHIQVLVVACSSSWWKIHGRQQAILFHRWAFWFYTIYNPRRFTRHVCSYMSIVCCISCISDREAAAWMVR